RWSRPLPPTAEGGSRTGCTSWRAKRRSGGRSLTSGPSNRFRRGRAEGCQGPLGFCRIAEGLLRAFTFEPARPIKPGASIGQSLQALRLLDPGDERVLDAALDAILKGRD